MRDITHNRGAVGGRLARFGEALQARPPWLAKAKLLIFLCGASVSSLPSPRRRAVQAYIHSLSSEHIVLYAEGVFLELGRLGHKKNILDLEHEISKIADRILIILESESAFCELGAFSGKALRSKLIVVNSKNFCGSESFINLGPIAATQEAKGSVLWYPMILSPQKDLDGIGAIYPKLKELLTHNYQRGEIISLESLSRLEMSKHNLYFVHDLILLSGPTLYDELIVILKILFPVVRRFDSLTYLVGILREGGLVTSVEINGRWVVRAKGTQFFLKYGIDLSPLMAAFRTHHLRNNPERYREQ